MRPGIKTTEFWTTLIAMALPAAMPGVVSAETASLIAAGLAAIYTVTRAYVKGKG